MLGGSPRHSRSYPASSRPAGSPNPPKGRSILAARQVGQLRDQIAHRAAGDEEPRLLAQQVRGSGLELDHGGIVAEDVVTNLGLRHRPAHLGRGPGDGVGSKVDRLHGTASIGEGLWRSRRAILPTRRRGPVV